MPQPAEIELFRTDDLWTDHRHETNAFFENGLFPLRAALDPLWAIRMAIEIRNEQSGRKEKWVEPTTGREILINRTLGGAVTPIDSVYATPFYIKFKNNPNASLLGLSCHLPDYLIPDSEAAQNEHTALEDLLADI